APTVPNRTERRSRPQQSICQVCGTCKRGRAKDGANQRATEEPVGVSSGGEGSPAARQQAQVRRLAEVRPRPRLAQNESGGRRAPACFRREGQELRRQGGPRRRRRARSVRDSRGARRE